ncbi:LOW QUALITY PROTEIN: hypothetical protein YC2023_112077 [Brassica napus]
MLGTKDESPRLRTFLVVSLGTRGIKHSRFFLSLSTDQLFSFSRERSMTPALSVVCGEKKEEPDTKAVGSSAAGDDVSSPVDDVQKKIRHAERFGVSVKLTEEEKRNSRAEILGLRKAVVAQSYARILREGENVLINHMTGKEYRLKAIGDVGPVVDAGGIIAYARKAGMIPSAAA